MDYQYNQLEDRLVIKFAEIHQAGAENQINSIWPEELKQEIGLLFTDEGKLTGLEISPASKYFTESKLSGFAPKKEMSIAPNESAIQLISKEQFDTLAGHALFEDPENDQFYGVIHNGSTNYKFGWLRDNVSPSIKWLASNIVALGIDKNFVIVNVQSGEVLLTISLDTYFVDTYLTDQAILVATQLAVFKIDAGDYSIQENYDLPDFFVRMDIQGDTYQAHCFDGSTLTLS